MVSVALILQKPLCMSADPVGVSQIQCTIFMVGGIATLLQSTFGIRYVPLLGSSQLRSFAERLMYVQTSLSLLKEKKKSVVSVNLL